MHPLLYFLEDPPPLDPSAQLTIAIALVLTGLAGAIAMLVKIIPPWAEDRLAERKLKREQRQAELDSLKPAKSGAKFVTYGALTNLRKYVERVEASNIKETGELREKVEKIYEAVYVGDLNNAGIVTSLALIGERLETLLNRKER
jgi:hypothetical protein